MVHSKTLFQGSNIIKNDLGRLSFLNNEDWSLFIEEKSQTSRLGFNRSSYGSTGWLAVSIKCLAGDRWASAGPRSDLDRISTGPQPDEVQPWPVEQAFWKREKILYRSTGDCSWVNRLLFIPSTSWAMGQPVTVHPVHQI